MTTTLAERLDTSLDELLKATTNETTRPSSTIRKTRMTAVTMSTQERLVLLGITKVGEIAVTNQALPSTYPWLLCFLGGYEWQREQGSPVTLINKFSPAHNYLAEGHEPFTPEDCQAVLDFLDKRVPRHIIEWLESASSNDDLQAISVMCWVVGKRMRIADEDWAKLQELVSTEDWEGPDDEPA